MTRRKLYLAVIVAALVALAPVPAFSQSAEDFFRLGTQVLPLVINPQTSEPPARWHSARPGPSHDLPRDPAPHHRDARIVEAQRRLNALGYAAGPADGEMGPRTRAAIRAFQRDYGLAVTGRPDSAFLATLNAPQPVPSVAAGSLPAPPQPLNPSGFAILEGFDLPYSDYRSGTDDPRLAGISVAECEAQCASDRRCRAFTFNTHARVCILKNAAPRPRAFAGAVSGIKTAGGDALSPQTAPAAQPARTESQLVASAPHDVTVSAGIRQPDPVEVNGRLLSGYPLTYGKERSGDVSVGRGKVPTNRARLDLALTLDLAIYRTWPAVLDMSKSVYDGEKQDDDQKMAQVYAERFLMDDEFYRYLSECGLYGCNTSGNAPFPAWKGADEFQRKASYRAFVREVGPQLAAMAPSFPLKLTHVIEVTLGPYDEAKGGFPLTDVGRSPFMGDIRIATDPIFSNSYKVPDYVPVPRSQGSAFLASIQRNDRTAYLAFDVTVGEPQWDYHFERPILKTTWSNARLYADPERHQLMHSFDLAPKPIVAGMLPDAEAALHGIPKWNGRLIVRGAGILSKLVPDKAVNQLGKLASLVALKQNPDFFKDDSNAFASLDLLEDSEQNRIALDLGLDPESLKDPRSLDEFQRRALLAKIRSEVVPLLARRAPALPIPVLILCRVSFGEYDFQRQQFPLQGECNAGRLSTGGYGEGGIGSMTLTIPVSSEQLPEAIQVPLAEAKEFKRRNIDARPPDDDYYTPILAVAGQLTGLSSTRSEFQMKVDEILFFRLDDLAAPFVRLKPKALPSLATVPAQLDGPLPLDDDTLALLMLKRGTVEFNDDVFRKWLNARIAVERGNWRTPWSHFTDNGVAADIKTGEKAAPALLVRNFAEWSRARAEAVPESVPLLTRDSDSLRYRDDSGELSVFLSYDRIGAYSKRLKVPKNQLFVIRGRSFDQVPGIGPIANIVAVLPMPLESYVVPIDRDVTQDEDARFDMMANVRIDDLFVNRAQEGNPLVVVKMTPLSAKATIVRKDGEHEEIGSRTFDISPGDRAGPAEDHPSVAPLGAEMADLLQLRFLPATVDDREMERMMISRFAYEQRAPEPVMGGRFFPDVTRLPDAEERARLLADFRTWSEARAQALPERLTISLEFRQGKAQFENWGSGGDQCREIRRTAAEAASPTEKQAMGLRLCDFLDAAWAAPDDILFLKDTSFNDYVAPGAGRGPRYRCESDPYCGAIRDARQAVGLPVSKRAIRIVNFDLVHVDRLPILDKAMRALQQDAVLQIDVAVTGASQPQNWPDTTWKKALRLAAPFAERFGLPYSHAPEETPLPGPTVMFEAKALAARIVDADSGKILATPALAPPAPLPVDRLKIDEPKTAGLDILGIHLGMPFEEADKLIRKHMKVSRVLVADRSMQLATLTGKIQAYNSGHMYISQEETEVIVVFDEPPAAPEKVVGLWRMVRTPHGAIEPDALKATLTKRYGAPTAVEAASPGGSTGGINFAWSDFTPRNGCQGISENHQNNLWYNERGAPADPPASLGRHYYPVFASSQYAFFGIDDKPLPMSSLCPAVLGVRYATYPSQNVATDEIVTWLKDDRAYAKLYYESVSRQGELQRQQEGSSTDIGIKF